MKTLTPTQALNTITEAMTLIGAVAGMMYICYAMMLLAQYIKG